MIMKKTLSLFSLLILFFFAACDKKEDPVINTVVPSFKATKNDVAWISTFSWGNYIKAEKKFHITGTKRDSQYYQEEQLGFSFYLSDVLRSSTITHFNAEWDYIIGGDAVSDVYRLDSTTASTNSIQLTAIDTISKHISGTFTIKLIRDKNYSNKGEIIQYKNGQFDLKYVEI